MLLYSLFHNISEGNIALFSSSKLHVCDSYFTFQIKMLHRNHMISLQHDRLQCKGLLYQKDVK